MLSYTTGLSALNNAQTGISVASNNIANTSTEGYRRTSVSQEESQTINMAYGNLGTGADITAIARVTNDFIEAQYLSSSSDQGKWEVCQEKLAGIETLFDQEENYGLEAVLENFWESWQDLAADPDSEACKVVVQSCAQSVVDSITTLSQGLDTMQNTINDEIADVVTQVNTLSAQIADLNAQIATDQDNNDLLDQRDQYVRDMAEILDIQTISGQNGQITIMTGGGYNLVDSAVSHNLSLESAHAEEVLIPDSTYQGEVKFTGDSSEEYLLEFISDGPEGSALFKASTDGGDTWLSDDNGDPLVFTSAGSDNPVSVGDIEIWFEDAGTTEHSSGDQYIVMPKTGLYWEGGTGSANITPLTTTSGEDVAGRVSGGSLAGLFETRDTYMGTYEQELDTLAGSLIYQVNALYSQGAGMSPVSSVEGTYAVNDDSVALEKSGLTFADQVTSGTFTLVTYDSASGDVVGDPTSIAFDPSTESLSDLVDSINTTFSGEITASVTDGTLELTGETGYAFAFGEDTCGVMAALGMNTFFSGEDASDMVLHPELSADSSKIHSGSIDGDGIVAAGNNDTALGISTLASNPVSLTSLNGTTNTESLQEYLAVIIAGIGTDSSLAQTNYASAQSVSQYFYDQQESVSGVNLDEELTNLTKYQQEYEAAAQIIQTTKSMFDTLLGIM